MDGRCKTCKWWEQTWWRSTDGGKVFHQHGECMLTRWDDLNGEEHPESLAHASGSAPEGPSSMTLVTSPDFGCIQWQDSGEAKVISLEDLSDD